MSNIMIGVIVSISILYVLILLVFAIMGSIIKRFDENMVVIKKTEKFLRNNNIYLGDITNDSKNK